MDSMRSLNTSLPAAYSSRPVPPEQLLQAFKTAALSVTNLYKSAITDQNNSRATGYHDALDDLLRFMDSENIGVQDGEGWRVRQWATERYDNSVRQNAGETEEQRSEDAEATTGETADDHDASVTDNQLPSAMTASDHPQRHGSAPPVFRFTAGTSDPHSDDMQVNDEAGSPPTQVEASSPPAIQVQVLGRNRTSHRTNNHRYGRGTGRAPASVAGAKRKIQQLPDFSDIFNINFRDDKDSGPSGKRSRLV